MLAGFVSLPSQKKGGSEGSSGVVVNRERGRKEGKRKRKERKEGKGGTAASRGVSKREERRWAGTAMARGKREESALAAAASPQRDEGK